ncbi:hypothetical protein [Bacillus sp. V5-8f]|uniref:hypothetical protein n=1 Tax=Bacillus sp. V5-8f TaxID=2053044 RepID=UPI000C77A79F|nr:hypothetical protein [Bacillus sp. V5-8f]PLT31991.1 hypothetical protein CUU64_20610 [Bacillus sp. V5-8f]
MENKKAIVDVIRDAINDSVFCYANKAGQGFVEKAKCQCYVEGKKCCDAYFEQMEFHALFNELVKKGMSRAEIFAEVENVYQWKDTSWIQYNVNK